MSEELRAPSEEWNERGLVDVAPSRMKAADDKVQLVAEETVMRIGDEMQHEGCERGDRRRPIEP